MVESLPTELVECIIDNLDPSDDRATLLNCALVGRAWVHASQRGIFQTILLKVPNPYYDIDYDLVSSVNCFVEASARLMALLDEKPVLVTYVLRLELQNFDGEETRSVDEKDALCVSVAGVVTRLSRVRQLVLACVDWDHLSSMLRTALIGMLSAPSMIDLTLHAFTISTLTDLISLLGHAMHLKALKALGVLCRQESNTSIDYTGPPPGCIKLDTLAFSGKLAFTFLTYFQQRSCLFRFENLRSLKILIQSPGGLEMAAFLLQQAGRSLKELDLVRWPIDTTIPENLLVHVPDLKSIRLIDVAQKDSYTPAPSILSLFKPLLSSDLARYPLQDITLNLRVEYRVTMEWDAWSAFDVLLENPKFDSLRLVDIVMKRRNPMYVSALLHKSELETAAKAAVEKLRGNLPFLERSGKLKISFKKSD